MNKSRMLFLLALLSAFPPLSTDMYLPAIPLLVKLWQQPLAIVNLTLVGFFVSYCVFLLFYGPLSRSFQHSSAMNCRRQSVMQTRKDAP